jgi:hypothetical protein
MANCVGVDVSKHHLDWVSGGEGNVARLPNTPAGIRRLTAALRKLDLSLIVVESTGGYERALVERLDENDLPVVLVNPWRVRRFGEGLGVLAKTDPIDAQILALYGERARPRRVGSTPLPPSSNATSRVLFDSSNDASRSSMHASMSPSPMIPRPPKPGLSSRLRLPSDPGLLEPSSSICLNWELSDAGRSHHWSGSLPMPRTVDGNGGFAESAAVEQDQGPLSIWPP